MLEAGSVDIDDGATGATGENGENGENGARRHKKITRLLPSAPDREAGPERPARRGT
jgi:hypothetical protein